LLLGISYTTWTVLVLPPAAFLAGVLYYFFKAGKEEGD
jgi:hypothetical protein